MVSKKSEIDFANRLNFQFFSYCWTNFCERLFLDATIKSLFSIFHIISKSYLTNIDQSIIKKWLIGKNLHHHLRRNVSTQFFFYCRKVVFGRSLSLLNSRYRNNWAASLRKKLVFSFIWIVNEKSPIQFSKQLMTLSNFCTNFHGKIKFLKMKFQEGKNKDCLPIFF